MQPDYVLPPGNYKVELELGSEEDELPNRIVALTIKFKGAHDIDYFIDVDSAEI